MICTFAYLFNYLLNDVKLEILIFAYQSNQYMASVHVPTKVNEEDPSQKNKRRKNKRCLIEINKDK